MLGEHSQLSVELSYLQLCHRSEVSIPSHTHQDLKKRSDITHRVSYFTHTKNKHSPLPKVDCYLLHGCNNQDCQSDEMQQGDKHQQVRHF